MFGLKNLAKKKNYIVYHRTASVGLLHRKYYENLPAYMYGSAAGQARQQQYQSLADQQLGMCDAADMYDEVD